MRSGRNVQRSLRAGAEVVAVAAIYIVISIAFVRMSDLTAVFPDGWSAAQRATGAGFLAGAMIQLALVLGAAFLLRLPDVRRAIGESMAPSTGKAWTIAGIATAIHIGTATIAILPEPGRIIELSMLNLWLSIIPAADGWTQEIVFRGYVLYRLARSGVAALPQVLVSGVLFAAIHLGYMGESFWDAMSPLIGTFMLGCFYAWSVQAGRGSLKPVIICHIAIIIILQPWLGLAR